MVGSNAVGYNVDTGRLKLNLFFAEYGNIIDTILGIDRRPGGSIVGIDNVKMLLQLLHYCFMRLGVPVARQEERLVVLLGSTHNDIDIGQTVGLGERQMSASKDILRKLCYQHYTRFFSARNGMRWS